MFRWNRRHGINQRLEREAAMLGKPHSAIVRKCLFAAAMAAVALCLPPAYVTAAPSQSDLSSNRDLRDITRLLEKDDNDVVIKAEDLPKTIRDYIAREMPSAKITEARKDFKGNKEKTGDNFTYEVDVKDGAREYELKFAPDGKLLKKRENAGDEPDKK
jgi:hypothetical protein